MNKEVKIANFSISNNKKISFILGPCQIENEETTFKIAESIDKICKKLRINFVFKSSFDKANRSSISGGRGIGLEKGLEILTKIKGKFKCPILTDVHNPEDCNKISKVVDIIQIPAFLCRQTDLILAAAETNLPLNIKKGQFLSPWEMENVIEKINSKNNFKIMLCERGTFFGYNNLVADMRSLEIMKETSYPVVMDVTHCLQHPGGLGKSSGGNNKYIETMSRAATAVGISAIFIETHLQPDNSPSDSEVMLKLSKLENVLDQILKIDKVVKNFV
tara:strand:- start:72 stop:899 length:828 start_codon:yes stop_codon:yes gene_type:complete